MRRNFLRTVTGWPAVLGKGTVGSVSAAWSHCFKNGWAGRARVLAMMNEPACGWGRGGSGGGMG